MILPMNSIYVGTGSARRLPSPWLDPSRLPGASCGTFLSYAVARMDLKFWLRPLSGKVLICDCGDDAICHARSLVELCAEEFSEEMDLGTIDVEDGFLESAEFIMKEKFIPAKKRSAETVGVRISAASQPGGQVFPQLVPDGLTEVQHLDAAFNVIHPSFPFFLHVLLLRQ